MDELLAVRSFFTSINELQMHIKRQQWRHTILPHILYSRCESDIFANSQATDLSRSVEYKGEAHRNTHTLAGDVTECSVCSDASS